MQPRLAAEPIITLSIGVATLTPTMPRNAEALIAAADGALYQAKQRGRNQTVAAPLGGFALSSDNVSF